MKLYKYLIVLILLSQNLFSNDTIIWQSPLKITLPNGELKEYLNFENATYNAPKSFLPFYSKNINLENSKIVNISIRNTIFQQISNEESDIIIKNNDNVFNNINIQFKEYKIRNKKYANIYFAPFRKNNFKIEKLVSFDLDIQLIKEKKITKSLKSFTTNSVFKNGNWFKVSIQNDAIYKITYSQLKSYGMNMENLSSSSIRIFGNGGVMLPIDNAVDRIDDVKEIPIQIYDGGDGVFNKNDFLIFYGKGPNQWLFENNEYKYEHNFMSNYSYYFITRDYTLTEPKRIQTENSNTQVSTQTITTSDVHLIHKTESVNLLKSGREWVGEEFNNIMEKRQFLFYVPNINPSQATLKVNLYARTIGTSSQFLVNTQNQIKNVTIPKTYDSYVIKYAKNKIIDFDFIPTQSSIPIDIQFIRGNSTAIGWLKDIQFIARKKLIFQGNQFNFRNKICLETNDIYSFQIQNTNRSNVPIIWNVTDWTTPYQIKGLQNQSKIEFSIKGGSLYEFIVFDNNKTESVNFVKKIINQNLHGIQKTQMVILSTPTNLNAANRLADFHKTNDNLTVEVVTTDQVYNEFSSGSQDMTAIRDFLRMLYKRDATDKTGLKYFLIFGDGSYDPKNIEGRNSGFIISYESKDSLIETQSFVTDDYFGFLDDDETDDKSTGIDIGIGRLPAKNETEANALVDKIISYYQPSSQGKWRTWITFVGDDEDALLHMDESNKLSNYVDVISNHRYNHEKIFLDAFVQEANIGGEEYPEVNRRINERIKEGALFVTYIGHGGERGWAHERILRISDIIKWTNIKKLSLFVTATCEFSAFDKPSIISPGEHTLLNPYGGTIGLLTTTRLVYSSPNYELTKTFMENVFKKNPITNKYYTLGDLILKCKTNFDVGSAINYRNFTLLGDPALRLSYPKYNVVPTVLPDTMKALQKVTIHGQVQDASSTKKIDDYNGILYSTVFNVKDSVTTLNNDGIGAFKYEEFRNTIFKGKTTVKNGEFDFSFIIPKDINLQFGQAKVSFYVKNGVEDGSGANQDIFIGSIDTNNIKDETGPSIQLWMNDESFVYGGITNKSPILIANVHDEHGINTSDTKIGHNIKAILKGNDVTEYNLNEYYEADIDSYKSGKIKYKLNNLPEGKYNLKLRVWDSYNNPSEQTTEFNVVNTESLKIRHLLNYPNPFTTNTSFYFEQNFIGDDLDVRIEIFTVSGKLVKTILKQYISATTRIGPINWNGRDDFGDLIGKGTYIYKIILKTSQGIYTEKLSKLVKII